MGIDEKKRICTCSNVKKSACTTTMASLQNVSNCNRTTYRSHLSSEFFSFAPFPPAGWSVVVVLLVLLLLFRFKHQFIFSLLLLYMVLLFYCSFFYYLNIVVYLLHILGQRRIYLLLSKVLTFFFHVLHLFQFRSEFTVQKFLLFFPRHTISNEERKKSYKTK